MLLSGTHCSDEGSNRACLQLRLTLALLHDQEDIVGVLDDLMQGHNIGVRRAARQHLRLMLPPSPTIGPHPASDNPTPSQSASACVPALPALDRGYSNWHQGEELCRESVWSIVKRIAPKDDVVDPDASARGSSRHQSQQQMIYLRQDPA